MLSIHAMCSIIEKACKELNEKYYLYDCNVLYACNWMQYINYMYENISQCHCDTVEEFYYTQIMPYCNLYVNSFAHNRYYRDQDGNVKFIIAFPIENMYKLAYNVWYYNSQYRAEEQRYDTTKMGYTTSITITDKDIEDYLIACVKHEVGHVLHIRSIIAEKGIDEGLKYLSERTDKDEEEYYNKMNELDETYTSEYDFYRDSFLSYRNMYAEKEADKAAGIDPLDFADLNVKIEAGMEKISV